MNKKTKSGIKESWGSTWYPPKITRRMAAPLFLAPLPPTRRTVVLQNGFHNNLFQLSSSQDKVIESDLIANPSVCNQQKIAKDHEISPFSSLSFHFQFWCFNASFSQASAPLCSSSNSAHKSFWSSWLTSHQFSKGLSSIMIVRFFSDQMIFNVEIPETPTFFRFVAWMRDKRTWYLVHVMMPGSNAREDKHGSPFSPASSCLPEPGHHHRYTRNPVQRNGWSRVSPSKLNL